MSKVLVAGLRQLNSLVGQGSGPGQNQSALLKTGRVFLLLYRSRQIGRLLLVLVRLVYYFLKKKRKGGEIYYYCYYYKGSPKYNSEWRKVAMLLPLLPLWDFL